jgi:hypothetical protein
MLGDIMIFLTRLSDYCGMAKAIKAVHDNAYLVVDVGCATGYYSFGHEMGHLFGTRHDTAVDSTTTPYAYGHAFEKYTNPSWRTIMGYTPPEKRINYWSNPNIAYGGVYMGDSSTRNNARVISERAAAIGAFEADCFGGESIVRVQDEHDVITSVMMKDLRVNDKVEAYDASTHTLVYSPVVAFLDHVDDVAVPVVVITYQGGELRLSLNHVLFRSTNGAIDSVLAKQVTVGDLIMRVQNDVIETVQVMQVHYDSVVGAYAPLTKAATVVVDGVVASSFSKINCHNAAHWVFSPLIAFYDMGLLGSSPQEGVHWYAELLKVAWRPFYFLIMAS